MPGAGLAASGVQIIAEGRVTNTANTAASAVFVTASFHSENGTLTSASVGPVTIAAGADYAFKIVASPSQPTQLWSVARPFLYTATIEVRIGGHADAAGQHNRLQQAFSIRLGWSFCLGFSVWLSRSVWVGHSAWVPLSGFLDPSGCLNGETA